MNNKLEGRRRKDVGRDPLRVERVDGLVINQHVLVPRLVLELGDVVQQLAVVDEKRGLIAQLSSQLSFQLSS